MAHVILKCVLEDSRLRIRFHAYVDENGEHTSNVYLRVHYIIRKQSFTLLIKNMGN